MDDALYLRPAQAPSRANIDARTGPLLLEFGTDWCGHCRAAQPHIAEALAARALRPAVVP